MIIKRMATISACTRYRYTLSREWNINLKSLIFIMCNPSTADGTKDDPTIRRLISFTQAWGFGGFTVLNIYAYRTKDPKELSSSRRPSWPQ